MKIPLNILTLSELAFDSSELRKAKCEFSFANFAIWYFSDFFTYAIPGFHKLFWEDGERLALGDLNEVCWIAFRESAKTTLAKIFAIWCICYGKKRYINFDSFDLSVSEAALFDIATALQTNRKIRLDFGDLYYEERNDLEEKKLKRTASFITQNKVKVEAFSTQQPTRGRIYGQYRPDLFILDDIENSETMYSPKTTQSIIRHIDELKSGLSADGSILYLGNYLTDAGVMREVKDAIERSTKGIVRNIPIIDARGIIAWPDKYVLTDEDTAKINRGIMDPKRKKISLESKRRQLGDMVYEREMMNDPEKAGDYVFDQKRIDELIRSATDSKQVIADFHIWKPYQPGNRYAIGADTAEGIGRDANASVLIDFSKEPNEQVGSYVNNRMPPDLFAYELKRQGDAFGGCLIAPEINNTGFATITALKAIYSPSFIYRREEKDKIANVLTRKLGWRTTEANKTEVIFSLKRAVEDGPLVIHDVRILKEMREYAQANLQGVRGLATRHFDLLMATALAWAMRSWAKPSEKIPQEDYQQPPYEGISAFESAGETKEDLFQNPFTGEEQNPFDLFS
jgi:hypothetical protein